MTGILGIYAFDKMWKVARFAYYGLLALQHRGQEGAGIVSLGSHFYSKNEKGLVESVFTEEKMEELEGSCSIGATTIKEEQPIVNGNLAFSYDGEVSAIGNKKIKNGEELANFLAKKIDKIGPLKAGMELLQKTRGALSFIALTKDGKLIVGRDKRGFKPLVIGGIGFDLGIVASETSVIDVLGADYSRDVKPGEVLVFDELSIKRGMCNKTKPSFCSFEYVYFARPDSTLNGIHICECRGKIGAILAKECPVSADCVIGVPETAIPIAMAYSKCTGIPVEMGFVRTGRHTRTAIKPTQFERLVGVQLKLNPIRSSVKGKRVVLIDDSVVRGNTMRNTVYLLRKRGAKEVHVRIGSPHIIARCPYGTEVPEKDELISVWNTEEEIAQIIGADSFKYLSINGLCKAIGSKRENLCMGCFTGKYPF